MEKNGYHLYFFYTIECNRNIRVSKSFMHKTGISLISAETFLSHSAKKNREGIIQCFRFIQVAKNFMDKKGGGRENHAFPSKTFVSQGRKIS